jgi:hypothetical protein
MKSRRLATIACAGVLAAASSAWAQTGDGSIGVYLDDAGTQCEGPISGFATGSVWMNLAGASAAGITGVEFRIDNSNASAYAVSFTPDPSAAITLGDPFTWGVNIGWSNCQTGVAGRIKVGTLQIIEMAPAQDVMMTVRQHFFAPNPSPEWQCPLITQCDVPDYTKVCVGAVNSDHWRAVMNPTGAIAGDCQPVAVAPTTWSVLKSLYGN